MWPPSWPTLRAIHAMTSLPFELFQPICEPLPPLFRALLESEERKWHQALSQSELIDGKQFRENIESALHQDGTAIKLFPDQHSFQQQQQKDNKSKTSIPMILYARVISVWNAFHHKITSKSFIHCSNHTYISLQKKRTTEKTRSWMH